MKGGPEKPERISPSYRQLRDYVTTGYWPNDVVNNFPKIDELWDKLSAGEQKQYRQLLLARESELNSLLRGGNAVGQDEENCRTALKVVELMKTRINALQPPTFDTWWQENPKQ